MIEPPFAFTLAAKSKVKIQWIRWSGTAYQLETDRIPNIYIGLVPNSRAMQKALKEQEDEKEQVTLKEQDDEKEQVEDKVDESPNESGGQKEQSKR